MTAARCLSWVSPDDYLAGEIDPEGAARHEYVNGQIYPMVGTSRTHARIVLNLATLLHDALQGSRCQVFFSNQKVRIHTGTEERFYYPDIQISCTEEAASRFNRSPRLIVEVLSRDTERIDRAEKLDAYKLIDSLEEYALVYQASPRVDIFRRADNWGGESVMDGDVLSLRSVDIVVTLGEIYA
jgi:Uma2 family endonuclease